MPDQYVNAAGHGLTLASGRPLGAGDSGPANPEDPHDKALIAEGLLVKVDKPKKEDRS
jgi:hypothetical protein